MRKFRVGTNLTYLSQMYCRPPLVKSMSRSSLSGQSQVYTAGDDDSEERFAPSAATQPTRRDSESKYFKVAP